MSDDPAVRDLRRGRVAMRFDTASGRTSDVVLVSLAVRAELVLAHRVTPVSYARPDLWALHF